jgi:hypothetical protein
VVVEEEEEEEEVVVVVVVVVGRGEEGGRECEWKRNAWRDIYQSIGGDLRQ